MNDAHADPDFLRNEAYDDAGDLSTRTRIQTRYRTHPVPWFRWVFERLRLPEHSRILELGCGAGDLWVENRERLPGGWQAFLSDFSHGMVAEARQELGRARLEIDFWYAVLDTQAIPAPSQYFDAVLALGLLDHVPDRVQALDEVRRVLQPGGRLYISAGGGSHLQEIEALVQPFLPDANYGGDPHRFGLENGEKLLSPWFSQVERHRYTDELVFDRAEPILAYVLSEAGVRQALAGEKLAAFTWYVKETLSAQGEVRVTTEKGLFEAW